MCVSSDQCAHARGGEAGGRVGDCPLLAVLLAVVKKSVCVCVSELPYSTWEDRVTPTLVYVFALQGAQAHGGACANVSSHHEGSED